MEFQWPAYWPHNVSIMGVHPLYTKSIGNQITDEMLSKMRVVDQVEADKYRMMQVPSYVAFLVPHSISLERLTILCKWGACLIFFDDLLEYPGFEKDEISVLMRELMKLPAKMRSLAMTGEDMNANHDWHPFSRYFAGVYMELLNIGTTEQLLRAIDRLERFITSATSEQAFVANRTKYDDLDQWLRYRLGCTGMYTVLQIMEFALGVNIPSNTWNETSMQTLVDQCSLQTGILNDLYSLPKEIKLNHGQIRLDSMNLIAYFMRTTGVTLQMAVVRCRDHIIEIDKTVAHSANTVKTNFGHDGTVCQLVDAMVYTLYASWAFELTSSRYWVTPRYGLRPLPLSGQFKFTNVDGEEIPVIIPDENYVNDPDRFWWNRELL